jgi:5-amino-6-(5-phosphoribosylamino)uracil reductase
MPRPYVICHMASTVDGRIVGQRWSPLGTNDLEGAAEDYEAVHELLGGEAWLVGRTTMTEFAQGEPRSGLPIAGIDRQHHIVTRSARGYAIGIDAKGKLRYHSDTANGNHIVSVLSEAVPDSYLAELRGSGISYVFAGETEVDLALALDVLARELPIKRLLLEGGGAINGAFLKAHLVDELSLLVAPAVDGMRGIPSVFDYDGGPDDTTPKDIRLTLQSVERRPSDMVWLRYMIDYQTS